MSKQSWTTLTIIILSIPTAATAQNIGGDPNSIPPQYRQEFNQRQPQGLSENRIGGDFNSIPSEHRAEYIRRNGGGSTNGGLIPAERIDSHGRRQQFINGQWVTIGTTKRTKRDSNGNYFEWENGQWVQKNRPGGTPNMPNPLSCALSGKWRCSCGKIWSLQGNGFQLSGSESGNGEYNRVTGTWSGNEFIFRYQDHKGKTGFGVITVRSGGRTANGRILWDDGTSSRPTLTKM